MTVGIERDANHTVRAKSVSENVMAICSSGNAEGTAVTLSPGVPSHCASHCLSEKRSKRPDVLDQGRGPSASGARM